MRRKAFGAEEFAQRIRRPALAPAAMILVLLLPGLPAAHGTRVVAPHPQGPLHLGTSSRPATLPAGSGSPPIANRSIVETLDLRNETPRSGPYPTAWTASAGPGAYDTAAGLLVLVDNLRFGLDLLSPQRHALVGAVPFPWPNHAPPFMGGTEGLVYSSTTNQLVLYQSSQSLGPSGGWNERLALINGTSFNADWTQFTFGPIRGPADGRPALAAPSPLPTPIALSPDQTLVYFAAGNDLRTFSLGAVKGEVGNSTIGSAFAPITGLAVDPSVDALAVASGGTIVLANRTDGTPFANLTHVPGGEVYGLGYDPLDGYLWTFTNTSLLALNATTGAVTLQVSTPLAGSGGTYGTWGVAPVPGTGRLFASWSQWDSGILGSGVGGAGAVIVNDTNGAVAARFNRTDAAPLSPPFGTPSVAGGTVFLSATASDPQGSTWFGGAVFEFNLSSGRLDRTIWLGSTTLGFAFDPVDSDLFELSTAHPGIEVYSVGQRSVSAIEASSVGNFTGLSVDPGNGTVYVADAGNDSLLALSPDTLAARSFAPLPFAPAGVEFDPASQAVLVWNRSDLLLLDPGDGSIRANLTVPEGITGVYPDAGVLGYVVTTFGNYGYRFLWPGNRTLGAVHLLGTPTKGLWPSALAYDPASGQVLVDALNGSLDWVDAGDLFAGARFVGNATTSDPALVGGVGYDPLLREVVAGIQNTTPALVWLASGGPTLSRSRPSPAIPTQFAYDPRTQDLFASNDPSDSISIISGLQLTTLGAVYLNDSRGTSVDLVAQTAGGDGPLRFAFRGLPSNCSTGPASPYANCSDVAAGEYVVAVTVADAWGATVTSSTAFTAVAPLAVNFTIAQHTGACLANGKVTNTDELRAEASGGLPPYSFTWRYAGGTPTGPTLNATFGLGSDRNVRVSVVDGRGLTATTEALLPLWLPNCGTGVAEPRFPPVLVLAVVAFAGALAAAVILLVIRKRGRP